MTFPYLALTLAICCVLASSRASIGGTARSYSLDGVRLGAQINQVIADRGKPTRTVGNLYYWDNAAGGTLEIETDSRDHVAEISLTGGDHEVRTVALPASPPQTSAVLGQSSHVNYTAPADAMLVDDDFCQALGLRPGKPCLHYALPGGVTLVVNFGDDIGMAEGLLSDVVLAAPNYFRGIDGTARTSKSTAVQKPMLFALEQHVSGFPATRSALAKSAQDAAADAVADIFRSFGALRVVSTPDCARGFRGSIVTRSTYGWALTSPPRPIIHTDVYVKDCIGAPVLAAVAVTSGSNESLPNAIAHDVAGALKTTFASHDAIISAVRDYGIALVPGEYSVFWYGVKSAHGAQMTYVAPGGEAGRAGLKAGDEIVSLDGAPLVNLDADQIDALLQRYSTRAAAFRACYLRASMQHCVVLQPRTAQWYASSIGVR